MLSAHQLSKTYGIQTVLQDITISLNSGDRIGLIGPNGCGKTTLMRILAGQDRPDSGSVSFTQSDLRIGYLSQGFNLDLSQTIAEVCTLSPVGNPISRVAELASALSIHPDDAGLQEAYDEALHELEQADISPVTALAHLGLSDLPGDQCVRDLSGGQKTRLMLARLLLDQPQLLLLDEPTNHLDIHMLEWLEGWLNRFNGAALIVSHDRAFLDNTVTAILELDPTTHTVKQYSGNYSDYLRQKEAQRLLQMQTYLDQQAQIRQMKADIARTKQQAAFTERQASSIRIGGSDYKIKGFKSYQQGIAKKVAKKAKSREKKLERFLELDELVERPRAEWQMKLAFSTPKHISKDILITDTLSIGYPYHPPLLKNLRLQIRGGQRIALTGPNGCGKTSLLRTIAGILKPAAGSIHLGPAVKLGYMTQEQELIDPEKSPVEIILSAGLLNETLSPVISCIFTSLGQTGPSTFEKPILW